jgi:hypothetical protein
MDENMKRALIGGKITSRDAIIKPIYHWPDGRVHFAFHSSISKYLLERKKGEKRCVMMSISIGYRTTCCPIWK